MRPQALINIIEHTAVQRAVGVVGWVKDSNFRVWGVTFDPDEDEPPQHMEVMRDARMSQEDWRWRYFNGVVWWWEPVNADIKEAVVDWLRKKGLQVTKHSPMLAWESRNQPELPVPVEKRRKVGPKAKDFFKLRDLLAAQVEKDDERERKDRVQRILAKESAHLDDAQPFKVVTGLSAFHTTHKYNLGSIQRHGLSPSSLSLEGGSHNAVFLASFAQCEAIAGHIEDAGGDPVIVEVFIPKGKTVYGDGLMPGGDSYYTREPILPRHIRVCDPAKYNLYRNWPSFQRFLKPAGLSPREFAEAVRRYPRDAVKPWLLSYKEYATLCNKQGKSHPSSAYQTTVDRLNSYIHKKDYNRVIKRINGIEYRIRKEQLQYAKFKGEEYERGPDGLILSMTPEEVAAAGHPDTRVDIAAFDGDNCVGAAQDEWGCVLYMVADEYKGEGIGTNLGHLYRSIYPGKDSGGFTPSGSQTFARVWNRFVADAIKYRKYDKAIAAGEITKEKADQIVAEYERDKHLHPNRVPPRLKWQKVADDLLRRAQRSPYITDPTDYEDVRQIILGDDKLGEWMWTKQNDWWTQELYDTILPMIKRKLSKT